MDQVHARSIWRERIEAEVALENDVPPHMEVLRVQDNEARSGAREGPARVDEHERGPVGRKAGRRVVERDHGHGVASVEEPRGVHGRADPGDDGAPFGRERDVAAVRAVAADHGRRGGIRDGKPIGVGERREDEEEDEQRCDEESSAHAATTPAARERSPEV